MQRKNKNKHILKCLILLFSKINGFLGGVLALLSRFHDRVPGILSVKEFTRPVLIYSSTDGFRFLYRTYDYHLAPLRHIQQLLLGRPVAVERSEQFAFRIPIGKVAGLHLKHLN